MKNLDFINIRETYNQLFIDYKKTGDQNKLGLFKKYLKTINEDEVLKNQFIVINNLESARGLDESASKQFLRENVDFLKEKYGLKDLLQANGKLITLLNEAAVDLIEVSDSFYDHVRNVLYKSRTPKNLISIFESERFLASNFVSNKQSVDESAVVNIPMSILTKNVVEAFNNHFDEVDPEVKAITKAIIENDTTKQAELFKSTKKSVVAFLNEVYKDSQTTEMKEAILDSKSIVLEMEYNQDSFQSDIIKLLEIKS